MGFCLESAVRDACADALWKKQCKHGMDDEFTPEAVEAVAELAEQVLAENRAAVSAAAKAAANMWLADEKRRSAAVAAKG